MEEVRKIVGRFINTAASEIGPHTSIDKNRLKSSILIHRMYAEIAAAGFKVNDYTSIVTYGELINRLSGNGTATAVAPAPPPVAATGNTEGLGIDIESISHLPETSDYRSHEFYAGNFTPKEISYCILKEDPKQAFAGLFSAKEAVKKSGAAFLNLPLNQIEIGHADSGRPTFGDFVISISHSEDTVVAVAIAPNLRDRADRHNSPHTEMSSRQSGAGIVFIVVSVISLIIALVALVVTLS